MKATQQSRDAAISCSIPVQWVEEVHLLKHDLRNRCPADVNELVSQSKTVCVLAMAPITSVGFSPSSDCISSYSCIHASAVNILDILSCSSCLTPMDSK